MAQSATAPTSTATAEPGMKHETDRHIERHPRQIEQRGEGEARRRTTRNVSRSRSGCRPSAPSLRVALRMHQAEHARTKRCVEREADAQQQPRAQSLRARPETRRATARTDQARPGRNAAARQHAVVDLQHEQRAGQHQHVDEAARDRGADERRRGSPVRRRAIPQFLRLSLAFTPCHGGNALAARAVRPRLPQGEPGVYGWPSNAKRRGRKPRRDVACIAKITPSRAVAR